MKLEAITARVDVDPESGATASARTCVRACFSIRTDPVANSAPAAAATGRIGSLDTNPPTTAANTECKANAPAAPNHTALGFANLVASAIDANIDLSGSSAGNTVMKACTAAAKSKLGRATDSSVTGVSDVTDGHG